MNVSLDNKTKNRNVNKIKKLMKKVTANEQQYNDDMTTMLIV